ncbi:MAG: hypothetical protein ACE37B_10815 [Ilumatobacter sp.]|uniref:hypothetical protein n=1 Tax=Ilumatobacter sp. TaxID=1967498 RepID=UPI00391BAC98
MAAGLSAVMAAGLSAVMAAGLAAGLSAGSEPVRSFMESIVEVSSEVIVSRS